MVYRHRTRKGKEDHSFLAVVGTSSIPLLANIGIASTCSREITKKKREGRKVAIFTALAEGGGI